MTSIDLGGRTAIVTGGARGLGAAIGRALDGAGARVAVLDLAPALAAAGAFHGQVAVAADVADEPGLARAIAAAAPDRLDILVANAGVVPPWRATADLDLDEWDRVFAVNVRGVAATLKHGAQRMADGGAIVLMASINAAVAHPRQMLYTATKHAVLGMTRAAALDLGPRGVRVNALAPGPIATEALLGRLATRAAAGGPDPMAALAAHAAQAPLGRIATADDVARAALFLCSDLARGITGRMLPVDGGLIG